MLSAHTVQTLEPGQPRRDIDSNVTTRLYRAIDSLAPLGITQCKSHITTMRTRSLPFPALSIQAILLFKGTRIAQIAAANPSSFICECLRRYALISDIPHCNIRSSLTVLNHCRSPSLRYSCGVSKPPYEYRDTNFSADNTSFPQNHP